MYSLVDAPLPTTSQRTPHPSPEEVIEDFLDHLTGPLVGVLAYPERHHLRLEVRSHLELLMEEGEAEGLSRDEAVDAALREFGDPWQTGEAILREKQGTSSQKGRLRLTRLAVFHGIAWFGPPTVLCLLLLEWQVLAAQQEALLPTIGAVALLGPVFGGCMTALTVPARAESGAPYAVAILASLSALAGSLLLPRTELLLFALFQLLVWLPLGWLSAISLVTTCRQRRRHRFLQYIRLERPILSGGR